MGHKLLHIKTLMMAIVSVMIVIAGCKKENPDKDIDTPPVFTEMPDTVMFVTTLDSVTTSSLGTTIYVLNASTGSLATKYHYPYDPNTTWCHPAAGNGFLYTLENHRINALNMNTGEILWTDTVNNYGIPVLHDDTFFGIYQVNSTSYGVYALDATKPSKAFLWKYELNGSPPYPFPTIQNQPLIPNIKYYNGTLYLPQGASLLALDAKMGTLKWEISSVNNDSFSLAALEHGVIMLGNTAIDAATGTTILSASPANVLPVYGPQTIQQAELVYSTNELYFVKTIHFNTPASTSFLSAVDRASGEAKWVISFGEGYTGWDTFNVIQQVWKNHLVVKSGVKSSSKYGTLVAENFWLLAISNGSEKLNFNDTEQGNDMESYIVNNTMYFHKISSTLGPVTVPHINYLYAIDLNTGKQKWNNDKLLVDYNGDVYSCVFTAGKGHSPFIQ